MYTTCSMEKLKNCPCVKWIFMYGCERWTIKKAECRRTDALELWLEKTLESPLESKEIKPVNPKGNQPWIFIGRTVLQLKLQYFGYLMQRADSLEKTWCWERLRAGGNRVTEDEMVGWHHWLNGHEFEQTLGDSEGPGSLACSSSWGHRESDTT